MTWYSVALFAHISGVLLLFVSMGVQWMSVLRLRSAETILQARERSNLGVGMGRAAPVSGVLILGAGVYLALTRWSLLTPWILVSLAAMALMMVFGMGVVGGRMKAIRLALTRVDGQTDAATNSVIPASAQARIDDPALWVAMQMALAVALSIVFLMTTKPSLALSIVTVIVALALGGLAGGLSAKPQRASEPTRHAAAAVEHVSRS